MCLEPLELIPFDQADRDAVARLYADKQLGNPLLMSLGAAYTDLYQYGAWLFDLCAIQPLLSVALRVKGTRDVAGIFMTVSADVFEASDVRAAGVCAAHAALCKKLLRDLQAQMPDGQRARISNGLFTGVDSAWEGKGCFSTMMKESQRMCRENGYNRRFGFTLNPTMITRMMSQSKAMPAETSNRAIAPAYQAALARQMVQLPAGLLEFLRMYLQRLGYVSRSMPLTVQDPCQFCYQGRYPFKTSKVLWAGIYKTEGSVDKSAAAATATEAAAAAKGAAKL